MSWLRKHLHWTVVFSGLLAAFIAGFLIEITYGDIAAETWLFLVMGAILPLSWGWVLMQKGRSLAWLPLALLVPFGWLCMFLLDNKNKPPVELPRSLSE